MTKEVNYEKIKNIIKVCVICMLGIPITLFVAFFFALTKVEASTSTSEIPFTQLTIPWEIKYGYDSSGTLTSSDMTANYVDFNYEGIERFTYYTGTVSSSSKIMIMKPQNSLMANGYYSLSIYYKFGSGTQIWSDTYSPCVGSYSTCGVSRNHNTTLIYSSNPNTTAYLLRPTTGTATYDNSLWERIKIYEMTWIFKPSVSGEFITLWFDLANTNTMAFYGYSIEAIGNDPVDIVNAISGLSTQIETQTTTINSYTAQAAEETQTTIEEQEQQTRDTITDSSTDFESPSIDTDTGPISGLLTMPITLAQSIINNSSSCTAFSLGELLGTNLSMPCIDLESILGSTLYNIIDVICCGVFIFSLRKVLVNVYVKVMSLRNINPGEVS